MLLNILIDSPYTKKYNQKHYQSKNLKFELFYECICVSFKLGSGICPDLNSGMTLNEHIQRMKCCLYFFELIKWNYSLPFHLHSVSICVFVFCWKPAGALSYILYSERELKPFKLETEYWQYVNRTEDNIFLRERRALKDSKWIDHTRLSVPLFPLSAFCKLTFFPPAFLLVLKSLCLYLFVFFSGTTINLFPCLCLSFMSDVIWTYVRLASRYLQHLC